MATTLSLRVASASMYRACITDELADIGQAAANLVDLMALKLPFEKEPNPYGIFDLHLTRFLITSFSC